MSKTAPCLGCLFLLLGSWALRLAFKHPPPPLTGGSKCCKLAARKIRWGTTGKSFHGISKEHVSGANALL